MGLVDDDCCTTWTWSETPGEVSSDTRLGGKAYLIELAWTATRTYIHRYCADKHVTRSDDQGHDSRLVNHEITGIQFKDHYK